MLQAQNDHITDNQHHDKAFEVIVLHQIEKESAYLASRPLVDRQVDLLLID